jgi:cytochrome o ubiquinol oxidase subunit 3
MIEPRDDSTTVFGFWAYLMTDLVLFAALFATYAVLRSGTFGGPLPFQLFDARFALTETVILLCSSFCCGLALLAARTGSAARALAALGATFLLGAAFVALEVSEFARFIGMGAGPSRSAFLSSYFALVGTHGLHVAIGLLWLLALAIAIARRGLRAATVRRLALFALFWHFLDLVWIFIFTIVYLFGL